MHVSIINKQKLYKTHSLKGLSDQKIFYQRYTNLLTKLKTAAKKNYYECQLKSAANNPKNTWDILRELLSSKKRDMTPSTLKFNNMLISDKVKITETFNNFFANVGHKISEGIESTVFHSFYLKNVVASSIVLSPTTPSELAAEIKKN